MNRCGARMPRESFQAIQGIAKCGLGNCHATILPVATQFDPFRFDQTHGPAPVEGPLPNVCLVDDHDDLEHGRPPWLRAFAMIVITVFLGVTVMTAIRQATVSLIPGSSVPLGIAGQSQPAR